MWLKKYFVNTGLYLTYGAIKGSFFDIFGGLAVVIVIWALLMPLDLIIPMESPFRAMPPSTIAFLTMILGALTGSVFGFCAGLKKRKTKTAANNDLTDTWAKAMLF